MTSKKAPVGALLIHGLTGNPTEMKVVSRFLEDKGYATATPLLPGHGGGHEELLAATAEDWLQGLRTEFNKAQEEWEEVFVVGLCASSVLAALLAAEDTRVRGIVLLSSHYGMVNPEISLRQKLLPIGFLLPRSLRKRFYWTEKPPYGIKDKRMQDIITAAIEAEKSNRETKDHGTFRTYLQSLYEMERLVGQLKKKVHNVKCPALLIHSVEDTWFTIENSIKLCEDLGSEDKSVLLINNCNHVMTVDLRKFEVARQIESFIDKYSQRGIAARQEELLRKARSEAA